MSMTPDELIAHQAKVIEEQSTVIQKQDAFILRQCDAIKEHRELANLQRELIEELENRAVSLNLILYKTLSTLFEFTQTDEERHALLTGMSYAAVDAGLFHEAQSAANGALAYDSDDETRESLLQALEAAQDGLFKGQVDQGKDQAGEGEG